MGAAFDDPNGLVPQTLSPVDSRTFEERTVDALRQVILGGTSGIVAVDAIELVGVRPDTLIVFRYHHRVEHVGRHPTLVPGPRAEVARLWEYAFDPEDAYSRGMMDTPPVLAAAIGSAFDAAELTLVDPETLVPIGSPPNIFPRR